MVINNLDRELKWVHPEHTRVSLLTLDKVMAGFRLAAMSEGKSPNTVAIDCASLRSLERFLGKRGLPATVDAITVTVLREFTVYLQASPRFAAHPFTPQQDGQLSGCTVNGYLRGLSAIWSWLMADGLIEVNPFEHLRIPRPPKKITPIFTDEQLVLLFAAINVTLPMGYRDYVMLLLLLDTAIRCSELTGIRVENVNLEARSIKILGKGGKERTVAIGVKTVRALWKYLNCHRPEPAIPRYDHLFLTQDGRPISKDRLEKIVKRHGKKAGITGVRVSPHTFRHTAAVKFLRNGGDVFTLQQMMGHASIESLRIYVNLAFSDLARVHRRCSPVDNLELKTASPSTRCAGRRARSRPH